MLPVCDAGAIELFSRKPLTQTVYMVGMLIGSFLFGWMSDKVGQKKIFKQLTTFLQIGRKATMMISLIILAFGGSFPFLFQPTPDLYYALLISRYELLPS